jgi:hypothetical protein
MRYTSPDPGLLEHVGNRRLNATSYAYGLTHTGIRILQEHQPTSPFVDCNTARVCITASQTDHCAHLSVLLMQAAGRVTGKLV